MPVLTLSSKTKPKNWGKMKMHNLADKLDAMRETSADYGLSVLKTTVQQLTLLGVPFSTVVSTISPMSMTNSTFLCIAPPG
jgi:hypothetical protein